MYLALTIAGAAVLFLFVMFTDDEFQSLLPKEKPVKVIDSDDEVTVSNVK